MTLFKACCETFRKTLKESAEYNTIENRIDRTFTKITGRALNIRWTYPALAFEKAAGMTSIGQTYLMPQDKPMFKVAKETLYINKSSLETMNEQLDTIIALNPELQSVKYDRTSFTDVFDTIMGITSGFNIDDINYYLQTNSKQSDIVTREKKKRLITAERLSQKTEQEVLWIPSPATAKKIGDHFHLHPDEYTPSDSEIDARMDL